MTFADWYPALLSPRLLRAMSRRRNWFVFGGCGFMLFVMFAYVMIFFMAWGVALEWDMLVLLVFGIAVLVVATRDAFAWRNEWIA